MRGSEHGKRLHTFPAIIYFLHNCTVRRRSRDLLTVPNYLPIRGIARITRLSVKFDLLPEHTAILVQSH